MVLARVDGVIRPAAQICHPKARASQDERRNAILIVLTFFFPFFLSLVLLLFFRVFFRVFFFFSLFFSLFEFVRRKSMLERVTRVSLSSKRQRKFVGRSV